MSAMSSSFTDSARTFLETAAGEAPDFSRYTVLIPHYHAKQPFLDALRALTVSPVFIPPRCLTLPDWVADLAAPPPVPASLRLSRLYAALQGHDWLPAGVARWALAQSMLDLIEELDAANLHPPASAGEFAAQLTAIERRYGNTPLALEGALIFALWRADRGLDAGPQRAYAQRLAARIQGVAAPVFLLGLSGLSGLEERALRQLAERVAVLTLPVAPRFPERERAWQAAWPALPGSEPLRARARSLAEGLPVSPLAGAVALYAATDLEDEAQAGADWVRARLAEGATSIGIVALDRLAARRLRALLERDAILLQDETGWAFPTTVISHVIDRWQTLVADDFYHRDMLDFLASPHCLNDIPEAVRRPALARLQAIYARTHGVQGLATIRRHAEAEPEVRAILERVLTASRLFDDRPRPLADWQARLSKMFILMGIAPALESDNAGRRLRQLLDEMESAVRADATRYRRSEWAAWLAMGLDAAIFQESDIRSPVRLTHLTAARLRDFDALLVVGCDARHLPSDAPPGLLTDAVRSDLGLPGRAEEEERMQAALGDAISRSGQVLLTWQAQIEGEANGEAASVRLLDTVHQLAWGAGLMHRPWRYGAALPTDLPMPKAPAAAILPRLPERLSASAWQSLVNCPYQYFVRYGLGLREMDEVAEAMEKKDHGECVHRILADFHALHPSLQRDQRDVLLVELQALSQRHFAAWARRDLLAEAWQARWDAVLPAYLDWAIAHSEQGYRCIEREEPHTQPLRLADGQFIQLYGRLDRCDLGPDGSIVIDYKTQAKATLRRYIQPDQEAVQLPFYGVLTKAVGAMFVGVDDAAQVNGYAAATPFAETVAAELERLQTVFSAIAAGQPLPANGPETVCKYCEVRGVCRKDDWQQDRSVA